MPNRLARSTSPYLRQHQDNPIDWFEWGPEAFEKAKAEGKPLFISVGYSSCHWCHVMAHETFEDPAVGEFLNEHFVSIKLDREERPDLDEALMLAVQMISGRGGWPMTIFATPDQKPFFAGTYFPKQDRGQYPGFVTIARQIAALWKTKRSEVVQSSMEIARTIERALSRDMSSLTSVLPVELLEQCYKAQSAAFDEKNGGFGEAPKFPAHSAITFLLDYAGFLPNEEASRAIQMVFLTLQRMALGGIHDHVGGGFSRYSTDAEWHLPHFEKMLYDNALLLLNYTRAGQLAQAMQIHEIADLFERVQIGLLGWVRQEMLAPNGMFYSAIDADSEGEEGLFYLWSAEELSALLQDRFAEFAAAFGIIPEGNYRDEAAGRTTGLNILHLSEDRSLEFRRELQILAAARNQRERPMTDTKCLAAWNGLMIQAMAECGELQLAERAATAWLSMELELGELPHQVTDGMPGGKAFLEDYAALCLGFVTLHEMTENPVWLTHAKRYLEEMQSRFADSEKGGFWMVQVSEPATYGKSKPCFDQPMPSGNALAIQALIACGEMEAAERHLMGVIGAAQKQPDAAEALVNAMLLLEIGRREDVEDTAPLIASAAPPKPTGKVTAKLSQQEIHAAEGVAKGVVRVEVPEGLHLNTSEPPARWLTPTRIESQPIRCKATYPTGSNERYEGAFEIPFSFEPANLPQEFEIKLTFQACTDSECLAPDEITLSGVILP